MCVWVCVVSVTVKHPAGDGRSSNLLYYCYLKWSALRFFACSWKTSWFAQSTPLCRCSMRRTTWSCPSWRWSWRLTTSTCSSTPRWGTCRKWFWWWPSRSPRPCSRSVDRSLPHLSSGLPCSARHSSLLSSFQSASSPPLFRSCPHITVLVDRA